jgi:hypothetical protein
LGHTDTKDNSYWYAIPIYVNPLHLILQSFLAGSALQYGDKCLPHKEFKIQKVFRTVVRTLLSSPNVMRGLWKFCPPDTSMEPQGSMAHRLENHSSSPPSLYFKEIKEAPWGQGQAWVLTSAPSTTSRWVTHTRKLLKGPFKRWNRL